VAAYNITSTIVGVGTTSPVLPQIVQEGEDLTVLIIPETGWEVKDVRVDGVSIGSASEHTFTDVYSDYHLDIEYMETAGITHTVSVQDNVHGIISPGGILTVDDHASIVFTVTASHGYTFREWVIDGETSNSTIHILGLPLIVLGQQVIPGAAGEDTQTFELTDITRDHTVGAIFDKIISFAPCTKLMKSEEITVSRKNPEYGNYNDAGYRVEGPLYQSFIISISKQPGQTQSGMLQAVGEQVRQSNDYDHVNKSWKIFSRDEIRAKDKVKFEDEVEEYEVLDVDDWTVSTRLRSINYRAMVRRIQSKREAP